LISVAKTAAAVDCDLMLMDDLNLIDPRLAERMMSSSSSGTYFQINNTRTKGEQ
jgi:hypothetical protein